jgi:hypothetical protein
MTHAADLRGALVPVAVFAAVVIGLVAASTARTGGTLIYPLDDTYVHMAIAKHTAVDGVWGVTSERFTSASSSPLWTGLLAATYAVTGVSDLAPLLLNILIAAVLLVSVYRLFLDSGMPAIAAVPWSLIVLFAGTVPTLTMIGMEHTLHALLTLWLIVVASKRASSPAASSPAWLMALAALTALTRYEGLFAAACVTVALLVTRRWRDAAAAAAAAALPVLAFGAWSISQGGFLLPNSVLLKGVMPPITIAGLAQSIAFVPALRALQSAPHLAALLIAVVVLAVLPAADPRARERRIGAMIFAGAVLLHMQFARAGWFFRYEAYLMVCGIVMAAILAQGIAWVAVLPVRRSFVPAVAALAIAAVLALPIARRSYTALHLVPGAASNIFEQQYQVAVFLDEHYAGRRIAVNDVGAVGYFADVRLFDIYGLASAEIAALKRRGAYTSQTVGELASRDDVAIAVIYPSWLAEYGGIPAGWDKAGAWGVSDNLVLGETAASFYAVGASRDALAQQLEAHASRLPSTVVQELARR